MTISAVVLTRNCDRHIGPCLASIARQVDEIVVIDGGSRDRTLSICMEYTRRIYYDQEKGMGFARDLGAQVAKGDLLVYVDSDTTFPNGAIGTMALEMETHKGDAIHPRIHNVPFTYYSRGENWFNSKTPPITLKGTCSIDVETGLPCMSNFSDTNGLMIKRQVVLDLGFDHSFTRVSEDSEFLYRLKKAHRYLISRVTIYHHHDRSKEAYKRQQIGYGWGNAQVFKKHMRQGEAHYFYLLHPLLILGAGLYYSLVGVKVRYLPFILQKWAYFQYGNLLGLLGGTLDE